MKNAFLRRGAPLVALLLVGVLLLGFGFYLLRRNVDRFVETRAVVTSVSGSSLTRSARVSYTVDGRIYADILLEGVAADAEAGAEIPVYYDPDDPSVIESAGGSDGARWCLLFGALLTVYAVLSIARNHKTLFIRQVRTRKE